MAINQIKIANEPKQDTIIANNVDILNKLNQYGVIKSVQSGTLTISLFEIIPEVPVGAVYKLVPLSGIDTSKCVLDASYDTFIVRHEAAKQHRHPALQLLTDGIYTTPVSFKYDRIRISNMDWKITEYN